MTTTETILWISAVLVSAYLGYRWGRAKPEEPPLTEILIDENGTLLQMGIYPFRCLLKVGQGMAVNRTNMTILSCTLADRVVVTRVQLHDPWIKPTD